MPETLPGWICTQCSAFNGEAKEKKKTCRACGALREHWLTRSIEASARPVLIAAIRELSAECNEAFCARKALQARCTELLEENRELRRRLGPTGEHDHGYRDG